MNTPDNLQPEENQENEGLQQFDEIIEKKELYEELKDFQIKLDMLSINSNFSKTDQIVKKLRKLKIITGLILNNFSTYDMIKLNLLVSRLYNEYYELEKIISEAFREKNN